MNRELIAQVAHEVNRAYCQSLGDTSIGPWADAPKAQKDSILAGVDMHLANPDVAPEAAHLSWFESKMADGWVYGAVKNVEAKEHPCMVPYEDLPPEQRSKDYLFRGVVHALAALPDAPPAVTPAADGERSVIPVAGYVGVKYVGRHDPHTDTLYDSGSWAHDQIKAVPQGVAARLLRHADVYIAAELPEGAVPTTVAPSKKKVEEKLTEEMAQEMRDQIQNMDKAALKELALTRFRMKVDGRLSLADTRAHVTQLVDQFGA